MNNEQEREFVRKVIFTVLTIGLTVGMVIACYVQGL